MAEVFVSYSHANRDRVAGLARAVEESGWSLWWDEKLAPGCVYAQVIEQEIAAAACVVVAWSATARESLWVRAEANEALDAGKIVQLTLDRAKLPLPFNALRFLDFTGWAGGREALPWPDLDARIGGAVRGEPVEAPDATEPALQGLGGVAVLGWSAIALAVLLAVGIGAAARGAIEAPWFSLLAVYGLGAASILLALVAWRTMRVLRASRR